MSIKPDTEGAAPDTSAEARSGQQSEELVNSAEIQTEIPGPEDAGTLGTDAGVSRESSEAGVEATQEEAPENAGPMCPL